MPTLCSSCHRTSGKCEACIKVDAMPMPEPVATGKGLVLDQGKLRRNVYFSPAQLRAARLEGARAAVEVLGKDAERYRALRDSLDPSKRTTLEMPRVVTWLDDRVTYRPEGLDAALDKAIEIMRYTP